MTIVKSIEKKYQNYFPIVKENDFGAVKRSPKFEFWKDVYSGKNDGVWLLWGIFKEYLKQIIFTAVLRKENPHSVVICRLIKIQYCKYK